MKTKNGRSVANKQEVSNEEIMETINIIPFYYRVSNNNGPTVIWIFDDQQNTYCMVYNNGVMSIKRNDLRFIGDCFGGLYGNDCTLEDFFWMARDNGYEFKLIGQCDGGKN